MKSEYKTIIIGAGPGGLIAGQHLENALILEKRKEIGKPVQCVGMSVQSLSKQGINPNPHWAKSTIYKVERIMPNGRKIGRANKEPIGYVVKRQLFEKELLKNVKAKVILGEEVIDIRKHNHLWKIITKNNGIFYGRYIIGADGFNSIVRKIIFPNSKNKLSSAIGLEYSVKFLNTIDSRCVKFYLNNNYYKGYGWVFPTSDYSANIGIGSEDNNLDFNYLIEEILKKVSKDYGKYNIEESMRGITGSMIKPFSLFYNNTFLIGDAAGLNDPIFKAGTNQAMISANIASQCIIENDTKSYDNKIKSLPFSKPAIRKAANIFYSFDNELLNEIGDVLENKSFSDTKNFSVVIQLFKKNKIRKNIFRIFYFLKVWKKSKKWLW